MALGALANGLGQVIGRTIFLLNDYSPLGVPVPLAVMDVIKSERPEYAAEVTDNPVEQGPEVSDHIQLKNPTLRLKGMMSATPLDMGLAVANALAGGIAAATSSQARSNLLNAGVSETLGIAGAALQGHAGSLQSEATAGALDAISRVILLAAYQNKLPFDVITRRFIYKNMVIQNLSFPRDENTGFGLEFEIELKQVRIVSPQVVLMTQVAENVISGGSDSTPLGSQATQDASPQIQQEVAGSPMKDAPGMSSKFPDLFTA